MNGRLSILVINAHWNNRGDEAAIRAMIDSLRRRLPVKRFRVMMVSAEDVDDLPDSDVEIVPPFPNSGKDLVDCALTLLSLGKFSLTASGRRFLEVVDEADVVIHAPGGPSIGDIYRHSLWSYGFLYRLFFSRIVKKKPIFFYAPSMGPFTHSIENLVRRFLLQRASAIVVREDISRRYLENQLGLKSIVTCDSVMQNSISEEYLGRYGNLEEILKVISERRVVGMTVTDLRWHPIHGRDAQLRRVIEQSITETIKTLIGKGYSILLIPMTTNVASDMPILRRLQGLEEDMIFVLPENVDSFGQQVVISRLNSLIGMRCHSNIFAAKGGIPFIPISYEHKMDGFMNMLGLPELTVSITEMTSQEIISRFEYLEENFDRIRKILGERVQELQSLSRETTNIIVNKILESA